MKLLLLPLLFLLSLHNTFGQLQRGTWILDGNVTRNKIRSTDFDGNNIGFSRDINAQTNTGYFLNRHFAVGLLGVWEQNKRCYTDPRFLAYNATENYVFLFPYLRYYFNKEDKFHFFAETKIYHNRSLFNKYSGQGIGFTWSIGTDYFIIPNLAFEVIVSDKIRDKDINIGLGLKYFLYPPSTASFKALTANYTQKHKVTYGGNLAVQKTMFSLDLNINLTIRYFLTQRMALFLQPHTYYQLKKTSLALNNPPQIGLSLGLERHFLLTPKTSLYWAEGFEMPSFAERQQISANYEFFDFSIRSAIGLHRFIAPNLSWFNVVYSDFKFQDNERNFNFQTGFQHFF
jgi:hypothetical protein